MKKLYKDRREAGAALGEGLSHHADRDDVLVLGLPRGGVPVAYEVAERLRAPLDVLVVRKLGVPGHEELAMGAIASGGVRILNDRVLDELGLSDRAIAAAAAQEEIELSRRERQYRGDALPPDPQGKRVILVDDGLATGSTMRAAVAAVRGLGASAVTVAVPVASRATCDELRSEVDELVCAATPEPFRAVGLWYQDFSQTPDDDVRDLLEASRRHAGSPTNGETR